MHRKEEKKPLLAEDTEQLEMTSILDEKLKPNFILDEEVIGQIQKLRIIFKNIIANMSSEAQEYFNNDLEILCIKLLDQKEDVIFSSSENQKLIIEKWQHFIKNIFLKEIQNKDVIFSDVRSDKDVVNNRYKQFSAQFHPDKVRESVFISSEESLIVMKQLNLMRTNSIFNGASSLKMMKHGDAYLSKYLANKDSQLRELRESASENLNMAIYCYREVINLVEEEAWQKYHREKGMIDTQVEARNKIASCYEYLKQYFHAQIYILGAIRMIEESPDKAEMIDQLSRFYTKLQTLKRASINERQPEQEQSAEDGSEVQENASAEQTSLIRVNNYRSEIGTAIQQFMSVIPEKSLVQHNIQHSLIRHVEIYKNAHYGVGAAVQVAGLVGVGATVAGVSTLMTTATTLSAAGAGAMVFGPIGWIVGGALLITAGVFAGIVVVKKGFAIANKVEIQKEVNRAIDEVFRLYVEGRYQELIDRLSDRRYFKHGQPIIYYDRASKNLPVQIINVDNDINAIDMLLDCGVRPDGIAFLLNIIAEALLSHKIETVAAPTMVNAAALIILNEIIDNKKLQSYSEKLDDNHKKKLKSCQNNPDQFQENIIIKFKNAYNSILNKNDEIILATYIKDIKEMSIKKRLNEMKNVARINYALAMMMSGEAGSFDVASSYLQTVLDAYKKTQYKGIVTEKIEIISDLMSAFGFKPQSSAPLTGDKLLEKEGWELHFEMQTQQNTVLQPLFEGRIKGRLSKLNNANLSNLQVYSILLFDKLKIDLFAKDFPAVAEGVTLIAKQIAVREYRIDEAFHDGLSTLIDVYESWVAKEDRLSSETKKYLVGIIIKMDASDVSKFIIDMSELVKQDRRNLPNHPVIINNKGGFRSLYHGNVPSILVFIIQKMFLMLPLPEQLSLAYDSGIDFSDTGNGNILRNISKLCHEAYTLPIPYHLIKLAFVREEDIQSQCLIIKEKLRHGGMSELNENRKNIFANSIEEIKKLRLRDFKFADYENLSKLYNSTLKEQRLPAIKYYQQGVERIKVCFVDDYNVYQNASSKTSMQGFFGNTESSGLHDALKARVIGQEHAIDLVVNTIIAQRRNKQGEKSRTFLLVGPTGVGKTELSKALSTVIYGEGSRSNTKERLVTLNMEKYAEHHSVATIIGSPAGYVGSTDEPLLVRKLKPFAERGVAEGAWVVKRAVILLDEYDRAHSEVRDALMNLIDESYIELTYTIDKKNFNERYDLVDCIIILTSNLLADQIMNGFSFNLPIKTIVDNFKSSFTKSPILKPETLGRMTVVPFGPIKRGDQFQKIVSGYLDQMISDYQNKYDISISISPSDRKAILEAIELEHYGDGTSIRTFKQNFRAKFERLFAQLNPVYLKQNQCDAIIQFDNESERVQMLFQYDNFGETVVIEKDENENKFYLTENNVGLRVIYQ